MAATVDFDTAIRAFAKILDVPENDAREVIHHLNPTTSRMDFFSEFATRLPLIQFGNTYKTRKTNGTVASTMSVKKYVQGPLQENVAFADSIAKGAYGTIFLSYDKKRVYKLIYEKYQPQISKKELMESKTREILLEAWIHTILSNDPVYGQFVVPVQGIFRSSNDDPNYFKMYLQMPTLSFSLFDRIKKAVDTHVGLKYLDMRPVFRGLTEALLHFRNAYGFFHRDLHANNVMYKKGDLKVPMLIDFGLSCLTFNGVTYNESRTQCESNDMLILMTNLWELKETYEKRNLLCFTNVLEEFIKGALKTNSGTDMPLNEFIQHYNNQTNEFNSIFHAVYPYELLPGKSLYDWLAAQNVFPLPHLNSLESFLNFIQNIDKERIEYHEMPSYRARIGPNVADAEIKAYRTSTMRERRPLVRQLGTRHLIGGRRNTRRKNATRKN